MTGQQIVTAARAFLGRGITYDLGADDMTPPTMALDCSAFVWRVLGSRKFDGKRWRNTDWIVGDITGAQTCFTAVAPADVQPGDIVVYGKKQNCGRTGHIGIVVDPAAHVVIDCSSSKNGVTERRADFFWHRPSPKAPAVFGRYKGAA